MEPAYHQVMRHIRHTLDFLASVCSHALRFIQRARGTMGSWDNDLEYGGPEPTWLGVAAIVLAIVTIGSLIANLLARYFLRTPEWLVD